MRSTTKSKRGWRLLRVDVCADRDPRPRGAKKRWTTGSGAGTETNGARVGLVMVRAETSGLARRLHLARSSPSSPSPQRDTKSGKLSGWSLAAIFPVEPAAGSVSHEPNIPLFPCGLVPDSSVVLGKK